MAGMEGHWALRGFGPYAIVEKESGALVGAAGLWHPGDFPETEVKWLLLREFWGRGVRRSRVDGLSPPGTHRGGVSNLRQISDRKP